MNIRGLHEISIVAVLLAQGIAQSQTPAGIINPGPRNEPRPHHSPEELTTARIRNMVSSPVPLTTWRVPLLARMGDAAAARIQSILKTRGPLSPTEQQNVVQMLHKAFERPAAITQASNRQPEASLALLQQLADSTTDFAFRLQIEDTKQFIFEATLPK